MSRKLSVPLALVFAFPAAVTAQSQSETGMSQFAEVYRAYEVAREAGNLEESLELSGEALRLGRELFGEHTENTAMLAQNYAVHLQYFGRTSEAQELYREMLEIFDDLYGPGSVKHVTPMIGIGSTMPAGDPEQLDLFRQALAMQLELAPEDSLAYAEQASLVGELLAEDEDHSEEAIEILVRAVEMLEHDFGDDSPHLISVLMALGTARARKRFLAPRQAADTFRRARSLLRRNFPDDRLQYADLSFRAGRALFEGSQSSLGTHYLEDAHDIYSDELGTTDGRTAAAAVLLGRNYLILRQTRFAERHFLEAIAYYDGRPEYRAEEVGARTLYVHAIGTRDPRIDVTEHLIALAEQTTWSDDQEYLPLLKVAAKFPRAAAERGLEGYVIVEFTVDETGRTADAHVVESTSELFEAAALEAASLFRYVPRIVDGERVAVPGVRNVFTFDLIE